MLQFKKNQQSDEQFMPNLLSLPVFLSILLFCNGCFYQKQNEENITQFKVRALWVDPPGFADPETVDRLIEKCKLAEINTLIPNVMLRENIYFQSDKFLGNVNANQEYDPLDYLIEKAHAADMEVHPWSCVYYSHPKKEEWISKPLVANDYDHVFLSPAHPEVNPYLLSVLEGLLEYDLDGIHLDYTRYWNAGFDYSETACERFAELHGFNPRNFLDHPDQIVTPEEDPYPVRVLAPLTMEEKVWELGNIERTMNRVGKGYAMISESPQQIDRLQAPGMLIVSFYTSFSNEILSAMARFVKRGGDLVWISPPNSLLADYPNWKELSGVEQIQHLLNGRDTISPSVSGMYATAFSPFTLSATWNGLKTQKAAVIATSQGDVPVVTQLRTGKGSVTLSGIQLMVSNNAELLALFGELIDQYRMQAGISGKNDLLAEKRARWIEWRASHILQFVTDVNRMVKSRNPKLKVTAAAGVGPQERNGIYREGGDWLRKNLCDVIFPMNYADNLTAFTEILDEQERYTEPGMQERIYPGLQIYKQQEGKTIPLDAEIVRQQLELIKEKGYQGFCLFAYSYFSDEIAAVISGIN